MALLEIKTIYIKQNYNHDTEPIYFIDTTRLASISFFFSPFIMVVEKKDENKCFQLNGIFESTLICFQMHIVIYLTKIIWQFVFIWNKMSRYVKH